MHIIMDRKLYIALAIYLTSLIASNTLGLKLMPFLFGTHMSVAAFFFPFVFLMTDVIAYVYDRRTAKMFVWAGFISTALFLIFNLIANIMPWSESAFWVKGSFETIFALSIRMSIASLLAFIIAEYQDIVIFFVTQKILKTKSFFVRSTVSNIWSQLLDTAIFMTVAFAGVYSPKTILLMSLPWWLYKVAMGLAYTPLSYLGIHLLKTKHENTSN